MTCPRCGSRTDPAAAVCPVCQARCASDAAPPPLTDQAPTDPGVAATIVDLGGSDRRQSTPVPARASSQLARGVQALAGTQRSRSARAVTTQPHGTRSGAVSDLVGQRLGDRYHITRLLGAGGMGAVYQAWDNELGVAVALKTVRPEVAGDADSARILERRFKQELLLARKVTHKNIVRVHDMGELDGIRYITMPYLEGDDLATILKREGRLPVRRVMKIARTVAAGLAAAHDAGVVHRDLKPANIMVTPDGEGLVMDFGVARSTSTGASAPRDAGRAPGATLLAGSDTPLPTQAPAETMAGSIVGTIEYMAPEQSRGEPVDQRADLYAFGLILYDLLLGRVRGGKARSALAELQQRMREAPPPLRSQDAAMPAGLDAVITRCLQPDAGDRYATTRELEAALARLDDEGQPLPLVRRVSWALVGAAVLLVLALLGGTWFVARGPAAPAKHDPVSILITDLANRTGDPAFDGALEPMLKLALEGAGFISAYDRNGIRRSLGVVPPDRLDERAGRELAVQQGVGVVLTGAVAREGGGYSMTLRAAESVTGNELASHTVGAATRDGVLAAATELGHRIRTALGDSTSDSARRFATEKLSATSLDVVREYAQAMQALSNSQFSESRDAFGRAVALDGSFGLAYAGMAIASANMGQPQAAQSYVKEAIRHVDRMTERERLRTRGLFYYLTHDYGACVKEYGDLLAQYEADVAARNNLALCSTKLRQMTRARDEMQRVVAILPRRSLYRVNASLYASYAGDFRGGEEEAAVAQELGDPWAPQALAFAKLGQGDLDAAAAAFEALAATRGAGPSYTASGLADIAAYRGGFDEAARRLAAGAEADLQAEDPDRAAMKYAALAFVEGTRGRRREAVLAADRAVTHGTSVQVRFLAGRMYAETGALTKAETIAAQLTDQLQLEPQAYGALLHGIILIHRDQARDAIRVLTDANQLLDTWIGHLDLGRAYLAAGAFPQADSEFDRCLKRSGEALSLFLDEEPSSAYLPQVHYFMGRAREGMGTAAYAESYRRYLAVRGEARGDLLAADARKRLARNQ